MNASLPMADRDVDQSSSSAMHNSAVPAASQRKRHSALVRRRSLPAILRIESHTAFGKHDEWAVTLRSYYIFHYSQGGRISELTRSQKDSRSEQLTATQLPRQK